MKDMEKPGFEDAFKNAFDEAGIPPSSKVWSNIEADLIRSEGEDLRHRLFFYKMVAAASVIFALTVAAFGLFYFTQTPDQQIAKVVDLKEPRNQSDKTENIASGTEKQTNVDANVEGTHIGAKGQNVILSETEEDKARKSVEANSAEVSGKNNSKVILHPNERSPELIDQNLSIAELNLPALYKHRIIRPSIPQGIRKTEEADPVILMLARLEQLEKELSEPEERKEKTSDERIWTSVGFAAGSFDGSNSTVARPAQSSSLMSTSSATADNEASASGVSYSLGVNVGTRLSDKWVLQGGVNYLTQNSSYTASSVIGSRNSGTFLPASTNGFTGLADGEKDDSRVVSTAPYNVNNSLRYLSLPLQAGYLLVDRKLGFQLNAGVSTDLFLQNSKSAEGGALQKIDQGRGDGSPYRALNFSGLMGAEVSYRFAERYRVALNPGVRYPFNSIYRADSGVKSLPMSYDIGLRFRYIFQ